MEHSYFPQRPSVTPTIYVYRLIGVESHKGYLKVGYTDRTAKERIEEQLHTSKVEYEIMLVESAMTHDGSCFTDKDVHRLLERRGHRRLNPMDKTDEWFRCSVDDVKAAIMALRTDTANVENRTQNFAMRPEQYRAVKQTREYYEAALKEEPGRTPKFLWNAKMRFGKTFASYQLARQMGLTRVLVLTFKPAVESAWREDLVTHIDFEGWQYISNKDARNNNLNIDEEFSRADKSKPIVVFGSFQDLLGTNESGGIKTKNEFIHANNWDLVEKRVYPRQQLGSGDIRRVSFRCMEGEGQGAVREGGRGECRGLRCREIQEGRGEQCHQRDVAAHIHQVLPLPVGHTVPRHQQRRVHRGADIQLDLL